MPFEPGRVDSPPISIILQPAFNNKFILFNADLVLLYLPIRDKLKDYSHISIA